MTPHTRTQRIRKGPQGEECQPQDLSINPIPLLPKTPQASRRGHTEHSLTCPPPDNPWRPPACWGPTLLPSRNSPAPKPLRPGLFLEFKPAAPRPTAGPLLSAAIAMDIASRVHQMCCMTFLLMSLLPWTVHLVRGLSICICFDCLHGLPNMSRTRSRPADEPPPQRKIRCVKLVRAGISDPAGLAGCRRA